MRRAIPCWLALATLPNAGSCFLTGSPARGQPQLYWTTSTGPYSPWGTTRIAKAGPANFITVTILRGAATKAEHAPLLATTITILTRVLHTTRTSALGLARQGKGIIAMSSGHG